MALWRIKRITSQQPGGSELVCIGDEQPTTVTLLDTTTNEESTITLCYDSTHGDGCTLPLLLHAAGYTPADWDGECGAP